MSLKHNKVKHNKMRYTWVFFLPALPAPPSLLDCELLESRHSIQYSMIHLKPLFAGSRITESVTCYLKSEVCSLNNLLFECKSQSSGNYSPL